MKYYIPILGNNIDNVLSSESISPTAYYKQRGYGYHSFQRLDVNDSEEGLDLYPSPILPSNVDKEVLGQLVYIEIDDDHQIDQLGSVRHGDKLTIRRPVNLYPWNSKFLFATEEALYQAVVFCRSSLCNKMWPYYSFEVLKIKPHTLGLETLVAGEGMAWDETSILIDQKRNKLKGFLYAYILGRYVSLSSSLAKLVQTGHKMYDIAASMTGLHSYQADAFLKELNGLEITYEKNDPKKQSIQKEWEKMLTEHFSTSSDVKAFEDLLKIYGGEYVVKSNFSKQTGIDARRRWNFDEVKYTDWSAYKKELEEYTKEQVNAFREIKGDTNTHEDFLTEGLSIKLNAKYGNFYGELINSIIAGEDWLSQENLKLHRLDVATTLTMKIRDVIKDSGKAWEGSLERDYLNELRQHIANGTPFDLQKAPSVIFLAFAIYILKGDNFEEMQKFMEYSAITDYRFVYGLWGVNIGYVDIPKTIVGLIDLDRKGNEQVYISVYKTLTQSDDDIKLVYHEYKKPIVAMVKPEYPNDVQSLIKDKGLGLNKTQQAAILTLWESRGRRIDERFFEQAGKVKGIGKVKLNKLRQTLNGNSGLPKKEPKMFDDMDDGRKAFDERAWVVIEPLLPEDPVVKQKVKEDFDWFIGRYKGSNDTPHLLVNYANHLYQKANPKNPRTMWTAKYFTGIDIEYIIQALTKEYQ